MKQIICAALHFARYNYISAVFVTNTSIKAEHTETLGMLRLFLQ